RRRVAERAEVVPGRRRENRRLPRKVPVRRVVQRVANEVARQHADVARRAGAVRRAVRRRHASRRHARVGRRRRQPHDVAHRVEVPCERPPPVRAL
ncbi:hypothetical protein LPJ73_009295, partial [Coemansia sp. RSA 2703]